MKSTDYIRRTLPHGLNLNILTQLFAEDGIEVTDEIRAYLNTIPWNTNIRVLESLAGNGSSVQAVVGTAKVGEAIVGGTTTPVTPNTNKR